MECDVSYTGCSLGPCQHIAAIEMNVLLQYAVY